MPRGLSTTALRGLIQPPHPPARAAARGDRRHASARRRRTLGAPHSASDALGCERPGEAVDDPPSPLPPPASRAERSPRMRCVLASSSRSASVRGSCCGCGGGGSSCRRADAAACVERPDVRPLRLDVDGEQRSVLAGDDSAASGPRSRRIERRAGATIRSVVARSNREASSLSAGISRAAAAAVSAATRARHRGDGWTSTEDVQTASAASRECAATLERGAASRRRRRLTAAASAAAGPTMGWWTPAPLCGRTVSFALWLLRRVSGNALLLAPRCDRRCAGVNEALGRCEKI